MRGRRTAPAATAPAAIAPVAIALALLLTACGGGAAEDDSEAAGSPDPASPSTSLPVPPVKPTPESTSTPTPSPGGASTPRAQVLDVVALPAAGGETDPVLEQVTRPAEATAYAGQFPASARGPLRAAIDEVVVPSGLDLNATVVLIGCEEPADVLLDPAGASSWTAEAVPPRTTVQCLVPVTYVALVGLPS